MGAVKCLVIGAGVIGLAIAHGPVARSSRRVDARGFQPKTERRFSSRAAAARYDFARHNRRGVSFSYPSEEKLAISKVWPQGVLR